MSKKRKHSDDGDSSPRSKRRKTNHSDDDEDDINPQETEQERRQRRLKKKLSKQAKIKKNEEENYFGYSNEDNPFGDANLTSVFIWKKKYAQHGLRDKQIKDLQRERIKDKQQVLKQEILKTKLRREQREREKEIEERMHAELAKEMELEENAGWKEKEEEFHQENAVKRSQIRIQQNRWSAIDIVAVNILSFQIELKHHHKIQNPVHLIDDLELPDLAQLLKDIGHFRREKLLGNEEQEEHWNMATLYAQYVFSKKNLIENVSSSNGSGDTRFDRFPHCSSWSGNLSGGTTLNESDLKMMDKIEGENLSNASYPELVQFESLCSKMVSGRAAEIDPKYSSISVDVNYWTLALQIAKICKAKAFLTKQFKTLTFRLKAERDAVKTNTDLFDHSILETTTSTDGSAAIIGGGGVSKFSIPEMLEREEIEDADIPMIDGSHPLFTVYKERAIDPDDDYEEIEELRVKVLKQSMEKLQKQAMFNKKKKVITTNKEKEGESAPSAKSMKTQSAKSTTKSTSKMQEVAVDVERENALYQREAKRAMDDGEHSYNKSEESIPLELRTTPWWHEKYRPRKPRYFNRVKTGYSWNKYNQTHYDPDNPPPKIVQGYKFNIFYPDLIDPLTPPTYKLYEKEDSEYAILIFHSGPPYQDIAFKIVNNEWEPSHRRGFRCRFEKGIFSLYFNFMRYRYRR